MTAAPALEAVFRAERRRVLATLIRLLGSFEAAEEGLAEALAAAARQWPRDGVPGNPFAWLVSAGRFKAIDRMRRAMRQEAALVDPALAPEEAGEMDEQAIADDQLRLIFTCCHPALPPDQQAALCLREVCGLSTEAVAAGFLVPAPTLAQRIVRAKARIRERAIPYRVPEPDDLPERLEHVLRVIYLIFNEGYAASEGEAPLRPDLSAEAIRLGRLLVALLPDPEAMGLLALMLLHEARRAARVAPDGALVLFADQDRALWDRALIAEGRGLVARAFAGGVVGVYALQAAIAAEHAAPERPEVDWGRVLVLYDALLAAQPSPVVELNRAVAAVLHQGRGADLGPVRALAEGKLAAYPPAAVALAELLRRAGQDAAAEAAFRRALALAQDAPVRAFIERRLRELAAVPVDPNENLPGDVETGAGGTTA